MHQRPTTSRTQCLFHFFTRFKTCAVAQRKVASGTRRSNVTMFRTTTSTGIHARAHRHRSVPSLSFRSNFFPRMWAYKLLMTIVFEFLFARTHAATCNPHAISLPFKGQTLATQAERRGLSWEVGNPKQNLSFVLCA